MEPAKATTPYREPKKDFAYYVPWVKEATRNYDFAIENQPEDGEEKPLAKENMQALEYCQSICEDLLGEPDLPLEDRILLNYYMCAYRRNDIRIFYLKQALATVEKLEELEGKIDPDPMREILETQLRVAEKYIKPPPNALLTGIDANGLHAPVAFFTPIQYDPRNDYPRVAPRTQFSPSTPVRHGHHYGYVQTPPPGFFAPMQPGTSHEHARHSPRTPIASTSSMQLDPGYGYIGGPSQSPSMTAARQLPTPTVIISEPSPPNERPKLINRIRLATARREKEKAKLDGNSEGCIGN